MFRDKYKDKRYFDEELVFNIETFNDPICKIKLDRKSHLC